MLAARHYDLSRDDPTEALGAAADALDRGQLVIVPTETVYGVAAREDRPAGVERLASLKAGRSDPFSLAIDALDRVTERLAPLPATARRIAARWWPGPVTQILAAADAGSLGIRIPGHPWTRSLIARGGVPLLLPSANLPGQPAPVEVGAVDDRIRAQVAVVIDGGRAALGESSTVVRPLLAALRVPRAGVVSRDDLRRHAVGRVLVLCTGNTCRSPMAAALLQRALDKRARAEPDLIPPVVLSAGVFADDGRPASGLAAEALAARGLDLALHRSRLLTRELLEAVDLVLGMTLQHVAAAADLAPDLDFPVELFDPDGGEIEDPFGGTRETYAACAATLEGMARARADRLCPTGDAHR